tara:strand:+ start:136 stop:561 length:426 start_codon:yes stop_codon:yes gene_type:complete
MKAHNIQNIMKLLPRIYCLLFTLYPVFASENPSDPINNFEIEKQRRSELSLIDDRVASSKSATTEFKSELFKSGKLIYVDDFNDAVNKEFWGQPKGKKIKNGILTVGPLFKSKEEAMKALKRDHHLGLEPVTHITEFLKNS